MNTRRKYKVVGFESHTTFEVEYSLKELLKDDNVELTYSLQERLDDILDLDVNRSLFFSFRDFPQNKGVILRIE